VGNVQHWGVSYRITTGTYSDDKGVGLNEKLVPLWREALGRVLADSLLTADQSRSVESRFSKLADVASSLEGLNKADEADPDQVRGSLEDTNLAARTLLSMSLDVEQEVSTWALLTGSRPADAARRIRALGLVGFAEIPNEWSELPRQWSDLVDWHRHAGARLRRLVYAAMSVECLDDVVILLALADCELARVAYVSTYSMLES